MSGEERCQAVAASTGEQCKRTAAAGGFCGVHAGHLEASEAPGTSEATDSPVALILGCAECAWDDLRAARELLDDAPETIIAVNDAGADHDGPVDHWVSLHPESFGEWRARRVQNGHDLGAVTWSRRNPEFVDCILEHWGRGTSGLYAVAVAEYLGFDKRILCGVPMDERPHYHDGFLGRVWKEAPKHRPNWKANRKRIQATTRSMSGWTRELLGAPTEEWVR